MPSICFPRPHENCRLGLLEPHEAEELVARLGLCLEAAEDAARDGAGRRLLHAPHDHAQMARLHDDGDALGLEDLHDGVGDLLGQALLDLQAAAEHLGDAGQLGDADDLVLRDVGNVHLSGKGHEVVLAQAEDLNVLDNDHLVVALLEDGIVDNVADVLLVALGKVEHGLGVALGRVDDAGAVGVLADALENGADGGLHLLEALGGLVGVLFETFARASGRAAEAVKVNDGTGGADDGLVLLLLLLQLLHLPDGDVPRVTGRLAQARPALGSAVGGGAGVGVGMSALRLFGALAALAGRVGVARLGGGDGRLVMVVLALLRLARLARVAARGIGVAGVVRGVCRVAVAVAVVLATVTPLGARDFGAGHCVGELTGSRASGVV